MRVLFFCHFWAPYHFAGSEMMGQNILRHLRGAGHETLVVATHEFDAPVEWQFDGTDCVRPDGSVTAFQRMRDFAPDVVLTHHGETAPALNYAHYLGVPIVQVIHNDMSYSDQNLDYGADFVIYNTEYLQKHYAHLRYPSTVLHPPVYADDHAAERGDMVTLINLNQDKGSRVMYELASRMPDVAFLAVEGGHGGQIFEQWPNVTFQAQTTDMKNDVWARTKILLVPSIYESYGMVGVEAMASGIPVIATPTFGLKESLGYAGTFVGRNDIDAWEMHIRLMLSNDSAYEHCSSLSLQRSRELDPEKELQNVTLELERLVGTWPTQHRKTLQPVLVVS